MKVGDLVRHWLTEQLGIILDVGFHNIRVQWLDEIVFGVEELDPRNVEVVSEAR